MKIKTTIGIATSCVLCLMGCSRNSESSNAQAFEGGFKTAHIIATRMVSPDFGRLVKFEFPGKERECDRQEIWDFMSTNHIGIIEGGGFPGAPIMAKINGVTNRASEDEVLRKILPDFEKVISNL